MSRPGPASTPQPNDPAAPQNSSQPAERRRIVYIVTEDWYFLSHRLPMARAARNAGYDVHVLTRVDRGRERIEREGFALHHVDLKRGVTRPHELLAAAAAVRRQLVRLRPSIVHNVALQPVIVGSLASLGLGHPVVNAVAGLGALFTLRKSAFQSLVRRLLVVLLNRPRAKALIQNSDDRETLTGWGVRADTIALIAGSGVDVGRFVPLAEPAGPFTAAYVGRMLGYKGVRTLIEAWDILRGRGCGFRLILAGTPDARNLTSIPESEIVGWCRHGDVAWRGQVEDVRTVWADAHVGILPSESEGLPLSLLEAAACGRPVIACDAPGSREIARPGLNAALIAIRDARGLADAVQAMAADAALRGRYGRQSRRLAVDLFSTETIQREIVALYRNLAPTP